VSPDFDLKEQRSGGVQRSCSALQLERGCIAGPRHRTAANAWTSATCRKEPQCPFSSGLRGDTTGLTGGKSDPKIAFQNKGLMNVIYDVLETKSDIDWF
jgi:hypothetical protein